MNEYINFQALPKATFNKIASKIKPFYRNNDEWTGTAHWAILSTLEPKFLTKQAEYNIDPNNKPEIDKVIKEATEKAKTQLFIKNSFEIAGTTFCVKLSNKKYKEIVNCYFIQLFANNPAIESSKISYWQEKQETAIIVKYGNDVIGVMMPIKK